MTMDEGSTDIAPEIEESNFSVKTVIYYITILGFTFSVAYLYGCSIALSFNIMPYFGTWDILSLAIEWGIKSFLLIFFSYYPILFISKRLIDEETLKTKPMWTLRKKYPKITAFFPIEREVYFVFFMAVAVIAFTITLYDPTDIGFFYRSYSESVSSTVPNDLVSIIFRQTKIFLVGILVIIFLFIWDRGHLFIYKYTIVGKFKGITLLKFLTYNKFPIAIVMAGMFGYAYMNKVSSATHFKYQIVTTSDEKDTIMCNTLFALQQKTIVMDTNHRIMIITNDKIKYVTKGDK